MAIVPDEGVKYGLNTRATIDNNSKNVFYCYKKWINPMRLEYVCYCMKYTCTSIICINLKTYILSHKITMKKLKNTNKSTPITEFVMLASFFSLIVIYMSVFN